MNESMTQAAELKLCPFCGSENVSFTETEEQPFEDSTQGFIWCHGCGFSSDVFLNITIAKQHWNRRAQTTNEPLTMEELREANNERLPIWIKEKAHHDYADYWQYAYEDNGMMAYFTFGNECESFFDIESYGKTWLAYRYRPAEEE